MKGHLHRNNLQIFTQSIIHLLFKIKITLKVSEKVTFSPPNTLTFVTKGWEMSVFIKFCVRAKWMVPKFTEDELGIAWTLQYCNSFLSGCVFVLCVWGVRLRGFQARTRLKIKLVRSKGLTQSARRSQSRLSVKYFHIFSFINYLLTLKVYLQGSCKMLLSLRYCMEEGSNNNN